MVGRTARLLPVLALVAGTGCFATRSDLQVVQNDLAITRRELLAADSVRRAQLDRVLAQLTVVSDSLRGMNTQFTRFQADVRTEMGAFGEQLIRVQSLLGISQQELQRLRAEMEQRANAAPPVPPSTTPPAATPTAGGAVAPPPAAGGPGPNELLQSGRQQIQRGAPAAGRAELQELLTTYPNHDTVPEALFFIAEAYQTENNMPAADSAWVQLHTRFPNHQRAPLALYRHALHLKTSGRTTEAKAAFQQVVSRYGSSDAAQLARDQLRDIP